MTAFVACRGQRPCLLPAIAFAIVIAAPQLASAADLAPTVDPAPAAQVISHEPVTVHLDQAKILKLPEHTATLVVGNPLIADAVVQPGGIVVITAKSYGATNLVALDRTGNTLMEHPIEVVGPKDKIIVVYRGIERESYSCAPNCERRITVGDTPNYFAANLTQVGAVSALAQQQQPK